MAYRFVTQKSYIHSHLMRKRRMTTMAIGKSLSLEVDKDPQQSRVLVEEIDGLLRVYKDGHVERSEIVPCVTSELAPEFGVISKDIVIDKLTNIWVRLYVPKCHGKLPLLLYFHGGGFCVGSAAWSCYHDFLARLSAKASCLIASVNYRLAPENPLPAAYADGFKALMWLKHEATGGGSEWWSSKCNFSRIFLAGDSAGANIAHNVMALRLCLTNPIRAINLSPITLKGTILIQPFFGGESRTYSEKYRPQPPRSPLTLAASDTYWRLSLPPGADRDHPWCNPMAKNGAQLEDLRPLPTMVCVSELDILRDRNLELCSSLATCGGKKVEHVVFKGVGHAFQILSRTELSQVRTQEMISHIKAFISR